MGDILENMDDLTPPSEKQVEPVFPRAEFFRPDPVDWSDERRFFVHREPSKNPLQWLQLGLRERFSAKRCNRPDGTPGFYFDAQFHGPIRIWNGPVEEVHKPGATILWPLCQLPNPEITADTAREPANAGRKGDPIRSMPILTAKTMPRRCQELAELPDFKP